MGSESSVLLLVTILSVAITEGSPSSETSSEASEPFSGRQSAQRGRAHGGEEERRLLEIRGVNRVDVIIYIYIIYILYIS